MSALPPFDPRLGTLPLLGLASKIVTLLSGAGEKKKNVWVHGPRHAGRTSLGVAVEKGLLEANCTPLRLELKGVTVDEADEADPLAWAKALYGNLSKVFRDNSGTALAQCKAASEVGEVFGALTNALTGWLDERQRLSKAARAPVRTYVLLIEDFDTVAWLAGGSAIYNFITRLVEAMKGAMILCILSVLTPSELRALLKSRAPDAIVPDKDDLWELEMLDDLTRAEVVSIFSPMMTVDPPALIEPFLNAVHRWTGGHFVMTQRLCTKLDMSWRTLDKTRFAEVPDPLELTELFVEQQARDLLLSSKSNANFVEIKEAVSIIEWIAKTSSPKRTTSTVANLAEAARALRGGADASDKHDYTVAHAILKLAGLARQEKGVTVLRRNRILESLFSPDRIQGELSGVATMTAEQGKEWLEGLGPGPKRAVNAIERARADAERATGVALLDAKQSRGVAAKAQAGLALLGVLVVPLLGAAGYYYNRTVELEAGQEHQTTALTETTTESQNAAKARTDKLEAEAVARKSQFDTAVEAAAAATTEAARLVRAKELAEAAQKKAEIAGASGIARLKGEAQQARDQAASAQRDADAAESKRKAAEAAKLAADAAAASAEAAHKQLTTELRLQTAARDNSLNEAINALKEEAERRKASEHALDLQRASNAEQQQRLDACEAAKKKAEAAIPVPAVVPAVVVVGGGSTGTGG